MKKLLFVLVAVLGLTFAASAQDTSRAIGGRFGGGTGVGAEFSFQQLIGQNNRLELDAGYSQNVDHYVNVAVAYHWRFPIAGDFNWFIGPCVNAGHCKNHGFGLAGGVQGGAEWNPNFMPLQVSLDARPVYDFLLDRNCLYNPNGLIFDVALGVRYRF